MNGVSVVQAREILCKGIELLWRRLLGIPNKFDGLAQVDAGDMCLRDPNRPKTLSGPS